MTCAHLNFLRKDPSANDRDASLEIIGAKVFTHFLRSDVWMMSSGDDSHGMERMISATSSLVVGSVMLKSMPVYRTSDIKGVGAVPASLEEILACRSLTVFMKKSVITWANPPSLPASGCAVIFLSCGCRSFRIMDHLLRESSVDANLSVKNCFLASTIM